MENQVTQSIKGPEGKKEHVEEMDEAAKISVDNGIKHAFSEEELHIEKLERCTQANSEGEFQEISNEELSRSDIKYQSSKMSNEPENYDNKIMSREERKEPKIANIHEKVQDVKRETVDDHSTDDVTSCSQGNKTAAKIGKHEEAKCDEVTQRQVPAANEAQEPSMVFAREELKDETTKENTTILKMPQKEVTEVLEKVESSADVEMQTEEYDDQKRFQEDKEPTEPCTPRATENEIENAAEKSVDVSSLESEARKEEIYDEKIEGKSKYDEKTDTAPPRITGAPILTEVKPFEELTGEASIMEFQLPVNDISTSATAGERGANEIEKVLTEIPKALPEVVNKVVEADDNDVSSACVPGEDNAVGESKTTTEDTEIGHADKDRTEDHRPMPQDEVEEGKFSESVPTSQDGCVEGIHESEATPPGQKTQPRNNEDIREVHDTVSEPNYQGAEATVDKDVNPNQTLHAEREDPLPEHDNEKEDREGVKIEKTGANDGNIEETKSLNAESKSKVRGINNDEIVRQTLATEVKISNELQLNDEPLIVVDSDSCVQISEKTETEDISPQDEDIEKIDTRDTSTTVLPIPINEHEAADIVVAVGETRSLIAESESDNQVVEDIHETSLKQTTKTNEIEKVNQEAINEDFPADEDENGEAKHCHEGCKSNIQSFVGVEETRMGQNSEVAEKYKTEDENKESKITESITDPNFHSSEEFGELDPTPNPENTHSDKDKEEPRLVPEEVQDSSSTSFSGESKVAISKIEKAMINKPGIQIMKPVEKEKSKDSISESKVHCVEEIEETEPTSPEGKTHTDEEKEEIQAAPGTVSKPGCQGSGAVIDGNTSSNQTLLIKNKDPLVEPWAVSLNETATQGEMIKPEGINKDDTPLNKEDAISFETSIEEKSDLQNVRPRKLDIINSGVTPPDKKTETEVTDLTRNELINEPISTSGISSETKTPETIKMANTSGRASEVKNIKLEDSSTIESQLLKREIETETSERISTKKRDAGDAEIENPKRVSAESEPLVHSFEDVREANTRASQGDTDKNKIQYVLEAKDQGSEVGNIDKFALGQIIQAGNKEEKGQISCSSFLPSEESHENKTNAIENAKDNNKRPPEISNMVFQLQEVETVEKSDEAEAEKKSLDAVCESRDPLEGYQEGKRNLMVEISGEDKIKKAVPEITGPAYADNEAVIDDAPTIESAKMTRSPIENTEEGATTKNSDAGEFEEAKVSESITESKVIGVEAVREIESKAIAEKAHKDSGQGTAVTVHCVEETAEIESRMTVEETPAYEDKEGDEAAPETFAKPNCQGVGATVEETNEVNIEGRTTCDERADISLTNETEVTDLGENKLTNKLVNALVVGSEAKTTEAIKTVDTSQQAPEVDSIKLEGASAVKSQLLKHENQTEASKSMTANAGDVEVENSKVLKVETESLIHNIAEVQETATSPIAGVTYANENEEAERQVPKALPEATNQGSEADSNDEVAPSQEIPNVEVKARELKGFEAECESKNDIKDIHESKASLTVEIMGEGEMEVPEVSTKAIMEVKMIKTKGINEDEADSNEKGTEGKPLFENVGPTNLEILDVTVQDTQNRATKEEVNKEHMEAAVNCYKRTEIDPGMEIKVTDLRENKIPEVIETVDTSQRGPKVGSIKLEEAYITYYQLLEQEIEAEASESITEQKRDANQDPEVYGVEAKSLAPDVQEIQDTNTSPAVRTNDRSENEKADGKTIEPLSEAEDQEFEADSNDIIDPGSTIPTVEVKSGEVKVVDEIWESKDHAEEIHESKASIAVELFGPMHAEAEAIVDGEADKQSLSINNEKTGANIEDSGAGEVEGDEIYESPTESKVLGVEDVLETGAMATAEKAQTGEGEEETITATKPISKSKNQNAANITGRDDICDQTLPLENKDCANNGGEESDIALKTKTVTEVNSGGEIRLHEETVKAFDVTLDTKTPEPVQRAGNTEQELGIDSSQYGEHERTSVEEADANDVKVVNQKVQHVEQIHETEAHMESTDLKGNAKTTNVEVEDSESFGTMIESKDQGVCDIHQICTNQTTSKADMNKIDHIIREAPETIPGLPESRENISEEIHEIKTNHTAGIPDIGRTDEGDMEVSEKVSWPTCTGAEPIADGRTRETKAVPETISERREDEDIIDRDMNLSDIIPIESKEIVEEQCPTLLKDQDHETITADYGMIKAEGRNNSKVLINENAADASTERGSAVEKNLQEEMDEKPKESSDFGFVKTSKAHDSKSEIHALNVSPLSRGMEIEDWHSSEVKTNLREGETCTEETTEVAHAMHENILKEMLIKEPEKTEAKSSISKANAANNSNVESPKLVLVEMETANATHVEEEKDGSKVDKALVTSSGMMPIVHEDKPQDNDEIATAELNNFVNQTNNEKLEHGSIEPANEGNAEEQVENSPKERDQVIEESKTKAEERAVVEVEANEKKDQEKEDKDKMADSGSEAPIIVKTSRVIEVKTAHKKSHNILSGVGSKVKHSIAKVKKSITGKSSHHKASSPKEKEKENVPLS